MKIDKTNSIQSARTRLIALAVLVGLPLDVQAQSFAPVTGLSGGAVSLIAVDRSVANPSVAVGIGGLGLFTGGASAAKDGSTVTWTAINCDACAWARQAAWDGKGQLWVAASGYGLWRGSVGTAFTEVKLAGSNIVQSIARGSEGTMWTVLGNGVVQIKADDSVKPVGNSSTQLGLDKLALPTSAGGAAYAASGGEVYALGQDESWIALNVHASPTVITQLNGSLYAGTPKGVFQLSDRSWSALGPDNAQVTGLALAANGLLTISTANAGVQFLSAGKWAAAGSDNFAEKRVLALASDANGTLYAGLKSGLNVVQGIGALVAAARTPLGSLSARVAASDGLPSNDIRDVVTLGNDTYALVTGQGVFSRVGKSNRWVAINDTLDDEPVQLAANSDAAYAVTASGSIYRLIAATSALSGWVKMGSIAVVPRAFAVGARDSLWLAGQGGVVLTRESVESKWTTANKGLERAGDVSRLLALSTGTVYAGTTRGGLVRWDATTKAWVTMGGDGLPVVNVPGGQGLSPINALINDGDALYVGTNHGVYTLSTASKAASWNRVGSGLPEVMTRSLAIDAKGNLIAGTINGAWVVPSTATGDKATWVEYASSKGEGIAALIKVGNEVIVATKSRPGKPGKVLAGG